MDELKPCPFCGRTPILRGGDDTGWYVKCPEYDTNFNLLCEVNPCTNLFGKRENAVKAWNRRANDEQ